MDLDDIAQRISVVSSDEVVQRLPKLLLDWTQDNRTALYILLALAVGFVVGRYRASRASAYQNRGEALLSHVVQTNFGFPDYHLMNHVTLQLKDGTTQVDHILVSRFGVFVIETKDYKGWIFADAKQANWTQVLFKLKFKLQNPIFQNSRTFGRYKASLTSYRPAPSSRLSFSPAKRSSRQRFLRGCFVSPGSWTTYANRLSRSCPSIECSSA